MTTDAMTNVELELRKQLLHAYVQFAMLMQRNEQIEFMVVRMLNQTDMAISQIPVIADNVVHKKIDNEISRLNTLKVDTIKALRLLIDKGLVSQKELNEAMSDG